MEIKKNKISNTGKTAYQEESLSQQQIDILQLINQSIGIDFSVKTDINEGIKKMRDYFENLIAWMPGHVYWMNREGIYLGCNNNQANSLGLASRYDIVGKKNQDLPSNSNISAKIIAKFDEINKKIMSSGIPLTIEETEVLHDGTLATFLSNKIPIKDEHGNIIGLLGLSIDITDKKVAERLQREKEEAQKRAEYLRAAAGSIAHEMRTPITSIRMAGKIITSYLGALISGYKLAQEAGLPVQPLDMRRLAQLEGRAESILKQAHFANTFIDVALGNLKEASELDTSNYHSCDIASIVTTCLEQYPFSDEEKTLIHWDTTHSFEFIGDQLLMINTLNNLIKNSLYFIKDAQKGEIFIWLETTGDSNILYFKDTAKGAPTDVVQQLFQSFYSRRHGGTGLGLTFCKKVMGSFGGDIKATSVEGEYMQFALSFPKA